MVNRAITTLARCSVRVVPAERREWAEAVWAEAGEVPDGGRLSWVVGGLWRVAREAGIVRRIGYWLGVAALAVGAADVVSLVWRGASVAPGFRSISSPTTSLGAGVYVDPHTTGEFRSLAIATVLLLVALPWVARRRGAFGPVSDSSAARAVRVGGCAGICVLVLILARLAQTLGEDLAAVPWSKNAVLLGVTITYLMVIPLTARRWSPRLLTMLRGEPTTLREEIRYLVLGFLCRRRRLGLVLRPPLIGLVPDHRLRGRDLRCHGTPVEDRPDHPPLRCRGRCCRWPHGVRSHVAGTRLSRR